MIKNFIDKNAEQLWRQKRPKKLPQDIHRRALIKLQILDAAVELEDLRIPPGNRLEALEGDRAGQHSIRINNQWRLCFVWHDGHVYDVEIVDYH